MAEWCYVDWVRAQGGKELRPTTAMRSGWGLRLAAALDLSKLKEWALFLTPSWNRPACSRVSWDSGLAVTVTVTESQPAPAADRNPPRAMWL